jgi:voltage-gated potassium channel
MQNYFIRKLLQIVASLGTLLGLGTFGLYLVESAHQEITLFDALFMVAITISTVGYGEYPGPMSTEGRIFLMLVMFFGAGVLVYATSTITAFIVEGHLRDLLSKRRMERMIDKMKGHYIVCGSGLMIRYISTELQRTRNQFLVVDTDEKDLKGLAQDIHGLVYHIGDVTDDDTLRHCGIDRARGLITAQGSDQENLYTIITARRLNKEMRIISSALSEASIDKLKYAGADSVVSANFIGSMRLVSEMIRPAAVSFLDVMLKDKEKNWRIEEAKLRPGSGLIGKTLAEIGINVLVLAVKPPEEGDWNYIPQSGTVMKEHDTLVVLGDADRIGELKTAAAG